MVNSDNSDDTYGFLNPYNVLSKARIHEDPLKALCAIDAVKRPLSRVRNSMSPEGVKLLQNVLAFEKRLCESEIASSISYARTVLKEGPQPGDAEEAMKRLSHAEAYGIRIGSEYPEIEELKDQLSAYSDRRTMRMPT